jgi:hypothetical protein
LLTQLLTAGKTGFSLHLFFSGRGIDVNKELDVKVLMSEAQVCVIHFFPCVHMKAMCSEVVMTGAHTTNADMIVDFHRFL